ncbi:tetratricopeptide repeat protein [Gloeobacter kilaueensis]|uniref:Methyl-accepting chemotaxis protein n=1 Tax=Gloeobacter kilaueensis (strain ATCC BAA-2537 / CCAP 1431/1 / ULC 316 / JS1) TaxID=1183438 RepID=U5QJ27_GLOK1|nr:tetratricopeptide repeat protein [Gloeobacter kilaueensis]AGY58982.1 methyl-accepting chemotaxis protein [Gloeobacter kilaueensis JS1]
MVHTADYQRAIETFAQEEYEVAEGLFVALVEAQPGDANLRLWLALVQEQRGRTDQAREQYEVVLGLTGEPELLQAAQKALQRFDTVASGPQKLPRPIVDDAPRQQQPVIEDAPSRPTAPVQLAPELVAPPEESDFAAIFRAEAPATRPAPAPPAGLSAAELLSRRQTVAVAVLALAAIGAVVFTFFWPRWNPFGQGEAAVPGAAGALAAVGIVAIVAAVAGRYLRWAASEVSGGCEQRPQTSDSAAALLKGADDLAQVLATCCTSLQPPLLAMQHLAATYQDTASSSASCPALDDYRQLTNRLRLLALNASIEAAHRGDGAHRWAAELGQLAGQAGGILEAPPSCQSPPEKTLQTSLIQQLHSQNEALQAALLTLAALERQAQSFCNQLEKWQQPG